MRIFDIEEPAVNPGFSHAMQIPLPAGKIFSESDGSAHPPVDIVNKSFVKHYFSSPAEAVGRRVARGAGHKLEYMTMIGVVRDMKTQDVASRRRAHIVYPAEAGTGGEPALLLCAHGDPARTDLRWCGRRSNRSIRG
jgi:hypothetical protein